MATLGGGGDGKAERVPVNDIESVLVIDLEECDAIRGAVSVVDGAHCVCNRFCALLRGDALLVRCEVALGAVDVANEEDGTC